MIDINSAIDKNRRKSFYRKKRHNLKIDMTPMVDLGFLLIAFFVITAEMSKPAVTNLYMPRDGDPSKLARSNALTVLLSGGNKIFYYHGDWETAIANNEISKTDFSINGIRNVIGKKQLELDHESNDLMILFKADKDASYQNLIDIIDEMIINDVRKYVLLNLTPAEKVFLEKGH